jgi:hypothetical protein
VAVVGPERVAHTRETLAALLLRDPATVIDDGG